jgi:hypothetical protein
MFSHAETCDSQPAKSKNDDISMSVLRGRRRMRVAKVRDQKGIVKAFALLLSIPPNLL